MENFLKEQCYYEKRYDEILIDRGKNLEKSFHGKEQKEKALKPLIEFFIRGDLLSKRKETIEEWMKEDKKRDDFVASCKPFNDIRCKKCLSIMIPEESTKTFIFGIEKKEKDRILYFYKCNDCDKIRAFYNNREEFIVEAEKCEKCGDKMYKTSTREGKIISREYSCRNCGHTKNETIDLDKLFEEDKKSIQSEKEEYTYEDFERYGFNSKELDGYTSSMESIEQIKKLMKDDKKKD